MAKRRSVLTNDGDVIYDQLVNGARYTIEPGKSIELPRAEAVMVRGHYCGASTSTQLSLVHMPIEGGSPEQTESKKIFVSPDGKEFKSKAGLMGHMRALVKKGDFKDDTSISADKLQGAAV